jgi:hypothetical protein
MKKDTFETVAAERVKELDVLRQRTAELRKLRLAQQKPASKKVKGARAAKSVAKESLSDWLEMQQRTGRKT